MYTRPSFRTDVVGVVLGIGGLALALTMGSAMGERLDKEAVATAAAQQTRQPRVPQAGGIVLPTVTPKPAATSTPTPSPEPTLNIWSSAICGCASDVYSCSDFVSQEAAQMCYNWCVSQVGVDVHELVLPDTSDIYAWDGWACITIEDWIKKGTP